MNKQNKIYFSLSSEEIIDYDFSTTYMSKSDSKLFLSMGLFFTIVSFLLSWLIVPVLINTPIFDIFKFIKNVIRFNYSIQVYFPLILNLFCVIGLCIYVFFRIKTGRIVLTNRRVIIIQDNIASIYDWGMFLPVFNINNQNEIILNTVIWTYNFNAQSNRHKREFVVIHGFEDKNQLLALIKQRIEENKQYNDIFKRQ